MSIYKNIQTIRNLSEKELVKQIPVKASWHYKYVSSNYIVIKGLNFKINEGDLVIVFSQYGEIVDCRLLRDKITGKSKGIGFICYEDHKSTILSVDNFNGIDLCGYTIYVDHIFKEEIYSMSKKYDCDEISIEDLENNKTGCDGKGYRKDVE